MEERIRMTEDTSKELVIYNPNTLDLTKHVRDLHTPLRNINPEIRIVQNGSMYAGGIYNIEIDAMGIDGIAYIRFLKALREEENPSNISLLERLTRKVLGNTEGDDSLIVEHENKKYEHQWIVKTSDYDGRTDLLNYNKYRGSMAPTDFLAELKTKIANQQNLLVSNELLSNLFTPLFDPLIQLYHKIGGF